MNSIDELYAALHPMISQVSEKLDRIRSDLSEIKMQKNVIDGDPILAFNEVCEMLHMGERQIRRYREQNKLVGFLLDGKRLYRLSEVQRFIAEHIETSHGWIRNRPKGSK